MVVKTGQKVEICCTNILAKIQYIKESIQAEMQSLMQIIKML